MRRSIIITVVVLFILQLAAQTIIGDGLFEEELLDYVIENYKTTTTLGYTDCRDLMYSEIDLEEGNVLEGIYSGYSIVMDLSVDPSTYAYQNGINCEHSWPQSMGAGSEPQKSDMHHLYPSRAPVNSSRGNSPFAEIDDNQTNKWWKDDFYLISIPEEDI
ncbi:MAG: endonuclease, partial [Candidatus Cloacimonadota bacterium]|nr:endonuclease [Candidatus Cloacimonadota bacterium]